ncbi:ABC transporter permease [Paenibacillus alvei]|uniref:ABC-2 type transport system permease protein n=1 Tax=Paenibacillus alvei TaxID=44250 RepID=A0A383RMF1_PAEAL|nr:ABC transporter permease [Paenibacillus alvei]SYX87476.1 ABC-2 type transport system permease protein [Paenibacillus alvei]
MSSYYNLIQNENMKIYRRPRTWIMIGILMAVIVLLTGTMEIDKDPRKGEGWQQYVVQSNEHLKQQLTDTSGKIGPDAKQELTNRIQLNEYYLEHNRNPHALNIWSIVNLSSKLMLVVILFTVVIAADMFAAEHLWGTIKLLLVGPASRTRILLSKYAATLQFAFVLTAINILFSFLVGGVVEGFGGFSQPLIGIGEDGAIVESSRLLALLKDYGFGIIELLMFVTLAFMISAAFRSSSMAIAFSLCFLLIGGNMAMLFAHYSWGKYILFANIDLRPYFEGTPLRPDMTLGFSIAVLVVYFLAFHVVSWLTFTKRDVAG